MFPLEDGTNSAATQASTWGHREGDKHVEPVVGGVTFFGYVDVLGLVNVP